MEAFARGIERVNGKATNIFGGRKNKPLDIVTK